jgi:NADH dehydrogenase [ubiquinone] 1 alpha subcomplex assembly factor 7
VSESVERAVLDAIDANGPITFSTFMEISLYGFGGFYDRPRVGVDRDFVTSPHVHPVFGELLAAALRQLHALLGRPEPLRMVEAGAGDGTLARQILASLNDVRVEYRAVEVGSPARIELEHLLGRGFVSSELAAPADVVVANELLDNLPFRVVRGGREVRIRAGDDRLTEVLVPLDDELGRYAHDDDDEDVVVPVGAFAFIDRLGAVLERGYAILIDYGGERASGGPVHGYRAHSLVADVLASPGDADITAGVDVSMIRDRARSTGLQAFQAVTQQQALRTLGFESWNRDELARQGDQLASRDGIGAVRTWSGRSRASLLVDPGALGRLRWLVLASDGLPEPGWLAAARFSAQDT